MHWNERGGLTMPDSHEVNAALRIANAAGNYALAKAIQANTEWVTTNEAQLTKSVALDERDSMPLVRQLKAAHLGAVEEANDLDIGSAREMLEQVGFLESGVLH